MSKENSSILWWVGGGCLALLLLGVAAVVAVGFLGFNQAKRIEAEMQDPDLRNARAAQLLGVAELPEGYEASIAISMTRYFKTVILTSRLDDDEEEAAENNRMVLYLQTPGKQKQPVVDYLRGETDDPRILSKQGLNMYFDDPVAWGEAESATAQVLWVTHYGHLDLDVNDFEGLNEALDDAAREDDPDAESEKSRRRSRRRRTFSSGGDGTTTVFMPMCEDRRARIGIWAGAHDLSDLEEGVEISPEHLIGSTGDPSEVQNFLGDMDFCRG